MRKGSTEKMSSSLDWDEAPDSPGAPAPKPKGLARKGKEKMSSSLDGDEAPTSAGAGGGFARESKEKLSSSFDFSDTDEAPTFTRKGKEKLSSSLDWAPPHSTLEPLFTPLSDAPSEAIPNPQTLNLKTLL